jgi:hypothetical protein
MPTLTPNYSFNLPLVNNATDADLWGGFLNANWSSLDNDLTLRTSSQNSSFSVTSNDFNVTYIVDATSVAITATLPATIPFSGFVVRFKAENVDNTITIDGNGQTIDGNATKIINQVNESIEIVSDGTNWRVLGTAPTPVSTESVFGTVEKATSTESFNETTDKNITADNALRLPNTCVAYGQIDTTSGSAVLSGGYNTTSASRTATGLTTITINKAMANTNYTILLTSNSVTGNSPHDVVVNPAVSKTTTAFGVRMLEDTGAATNNIDGVFYFMVFGEIA